uniref:Uncharacterized protein n=1 Tax=Meloidogyne enterolobii TaxID=390850 RepID=A0A6V7WFG1_MELEN|nr:unnamed protein product [Meloidogyne enterolobii]
MLQFFLATLLSAVFDVESLPIGDGLIRIKRYARIESGPDGWLVFNIGAWNVLFCVVWFYLGISILIYCTTRCYISCCSLLATAAERSAAKHDEKDKSDSEVVHSITINVRRSGSEHTQASSKSEKSVPTALETKDKVILVPKIRQKLFTCREMSRRTVREATDSKRKFKPMKTAVSGRGLRAATNTAVGHSKRGGKKPSLHADSARSTRSGTISGSSNVSTPSSSSGSSSSSSSSPASESYTISEVSYGRSKRSSRSGRSERSKRSKRSSRGSKRSLRGSKRSSRGGRSKRKSSKRSGRSRK